METTSTGSKATPPLNAEQIRLWSKLPFEEHDYPIAEPDPLEIQVERAIEWVENVTGRDLEDPPDGMNQRLREAVQRRVEWIVIAGNEDSIETAGDFDLLKSLSAGSYNESRRDIGEVDKAKVVHPWPLLNDLLWGCMTDEKKDEWREKWGEVVPAWAITEVDWTAGDELSYGEYLGEI